MRSSALALSLLVAGCGGGDSVLTVQVFAPRGSLQCIDSGVSLDTLQRRLVDGGIEVFAAACGTDGRSYPQICGAPDGAIGVFEIPASQVEAAADLLFVPLATVATARVVPCA